jgi:hypothetical protein
MMSWLWTLTGSMGNARDIRNRDKLFVEPKQHD